MFQLIYSSVARCEFSSQDLKRLLMRARTKNRDANVTGMLLYHDGTFLQALEGEEAAVRQVFDRISHDPRHAQVSIIDQTLSFSNRRAFGEWSMGFSAMGNAQIMTGFVELAAGRDDLLTLDKTRATELLARHCEERVREQID